MNRKFGSNLVYPLVRKRISRIKLALRVCPLLLLGFWLVGCDDDPSPT